jgi:hypothetical protein
MGTPLSAYNRLSIYLDRSSAAAKTIHENRTVGNKKEKEHLEFGITYTPSWKNIGLSKEDVCLRNIAALMLRSQSG